MTFTNFLSFLEKAVADLSASCPDSKLAVVGTYNTTTVFRNTPMTDSECGRLFDEAAAMAHLGKGIFMESSHTKLLDAIRETYEGTDEEYHRALMMVDELFRSKK